MEADRKAILKALNSYILDSDDETIRNTKFYCISTNVMCATREDIDPENCLTEDIYYPLEIGICGFTIEKGVFYQFNKFTDPGSVPPAMSRVCKDHAVKHQIPLEDFAFAIGCCKDPETKKYNLEAREKEFDELICDIHEEISDSSLVPVNAVENRQIIMLFSQPDQIFQNKGCLRFLAEEAGYESFNEKIIVLDVGDLFFYLSRKKGFKMKPFLLDLLESSKFDFEGRCDYHKNTETKYCAISVARKHCWLMLEKLCELYGVRPTPAHKPEQRRRIAPVVEDQNYLDGW